MTAILDEKFSGSGPDGGSCTVTVCGIVETLNTNPFRST
jgi:hypothetical protein